MFVAIRLCCKRRLSATAKLLLLEVSKAGLVVDLLTVNTVVQQLIHSGDIDDAIELLDIAQKKAFGERIQCDMSTFSMIIESASRLKNREMMRKAFELVYRDRPSYNPTLNTNNTTTTTTTTEMMDNMTENNNERKIYKPRSYQSALAIGSKSWHPFEVSPTRGGVSFVRESVSSADSKMLIQALELSAAVGDMASSVDIFDIVNRTSESIPVQIYSLLLSSFLVRPLNLTEAALHRDKMEQVVWEVVSREIDHKEINVANLVLRFIVCVMQKSALSELYLGRMIKVLHYRPSALALQEYSQALAENHPIDVVGATRYHYFIQPIGVKPSRAIKLTSLHR